MTSSLVITKKQDVIVIISMHKSIGNRVIRLAAKFNKYGCTYHRNLFGWTCAWRSFASRQASVWGDFAGTVALFHSILGTRRRSNATVKGCPFLNLCVMRPITLLTISVSSENPGYTPDCKFRLYQAGCIRYLGCAVTGIVLFKNEICLLMTKMSRTGVKRCN